MLRETRWLRETKLPRALLSLILILGGTLFLALADASALESGPSLCIIKKLSGHDCPGCGTTRAIAAILRADPRQAVGHNRLIVITFPLLAWVIFRELASSIHTLCRWLSRRRSLLTSTK